MNIRNDTFIKKDFGGNRLSFKKGNTESNALGDYFNSPLSLNKISLYDFLLYGTILPPHTPIEGVTLGFPGDYEENKNAFSSIKIPRTHPVSVLVDRLDAFLENYFTPRSEKNIGLMLSGGIDSALLLSYMGKETPCYTFGGAGESDVDVVFSKNNAEAFGAKNHTLLFRDEEYDFELYKNAVVSLKVPLLYGNTIPYVRISYQAKKDNVHFLTTGQNADTLSLAYPAPFLTVQRLQFAQFVPNVLLQLLSRVVSGRRKYILQTASPARLMAFFKSSGLYPSPWISVPENYFEEKEALLKKYLPLERCSIHQKVILIEEFMTESRRNQVLQNELPLLYGINTLTPYYEEECIDIGLSMPFSSLPFHLRNGYEKVVFRTLAEKRGVPHSVLNKAKKGLSYKTTNLENPHHKELWHKMVRDEFLNEYIDVKKVYEHEPKNIYIFDVLRSLYYWGEWVLKPHLK